jgi:hypothetical protein
VIHLALLIPSTLLAAAVCLVALIGLYALVSALLRAVAQVATGLAFCVLVAPLWLWEKGRRPMWRTLTRQQTRELEAWLRRAT